VENSLWNYEIVLIISILKVTLMSYAFM